MKQVVVEWPFLFPGANGEAGIKRSHWTAYNRLKKLAIRIAEEKDLGFIQGRVDMKWERWSTKKMDWDNFASTFKIPMDACVEIGLIEDDNPDVCNRPDLVQHVIKKSENPKTRVTFTVLEEQKPLEVGWD